MADFTDTFSLDLSIIENQEEVNNHSDAYAFGTSSEEAVSPAPSFETFPVLHAVEHEPFPKGQYIGHIPAIPARSGTIPTSPHHEPYITPALSIPIPATIRTDRPITPIFLHIDISQKIITQQRSV